MDFSFSEEQVLIVESLGKAFEADYDFDKRRQVLSDTAHFHSADMWAQMAELGFAGLMAPEAAGGFGGGPVELIAVAEELSKHLSLEPFLSSAVMAVKAIEAGASDAQQSDWLAGLAAGETLMAVALYEPGRRYDLEAPATRAEAAGDGYTLSGRKAVVLGADAAEQVIVAAATADGGTGLFAVDTSAEGVNRVSYRLVDGRGAADLTLDGVAVGADARLAGDADAVAVLRHVEAWAILASLAESLGAMEQAKDLTLEYLKTREQFGRPIGSFQVLQHDMANIMSELEYARSMVYWAASGMAETDPAARDRTLSGAKAYVDRAARFIAESAVQMHGGIGVTDEYPLSHYVKRLTLGQMLFGDRDEHLLRYTEG